MARQSFLVSISVAVTGCAALLFHTAGFGAGDVISGLRTRLTNTGSILNTRHNMTQSTLPSTGASQMDNYRNDYGEVCVYCHTPHAANSAAGTPLWNRTLPSGATFTTYATLNSSTLTQTVTVPGGNSLVCLSCHDGSFAIDSVLNMPGSGRYSANPDNAFLDTWPSDTFGGVSHSKLSMGNAFSETCLACHQPTANGGQSGAAFDFTVAVIGKDLRDDHPVGIRFPTDNPDFNPTTGTQNGAKFYDLNGNGRMDKNEVRIYDTGSGHEVECSTCHDPHGVPSGGAGSQFYPTFLRVANSGSGLCMTCHVK